MKEVIPTYEKFCFRGAGDYHFVDEDTLFYTSLFVPEDGREEVCALYYRIEEDGSFSPHVLTLETPPLCQGFTYYQDSHPNCLYLREKNSILFQMRTADGEEWLTWDAQSGRLLDRRPAENTYRASVYEGDFRDGIIYEVEEDYEKLTFDLVAYDIAADKRECLVTGPLVLTDPNDREPHMGWLRPVWLSKIQDGKTFVFRAGYSSDPEGYLEAVWNRDEGSPIRFVERSQSPEYAPWKTQRELEQVTVLTTLPTGELLVLAE